MIRPSLLDGTRVLGRALLRKEAPSGLLAGVLCGTGIPVEALAQQRPSDNWGMHPFWGWGGWGMGTMLILFVFGGLVIVAIVLGIRWLITQGREVQTDSPLDTLKRRYARGEIDKDQFEAMKRDLM